MDLLLAAVSSLRVPLTGDTQSFAVAARMNTVGNAAGDSPDVTVAVRAGTGVTLHGSNVAHAEGNGRCDRASQRECRSADGQAGARREKAQKGVARPVHGHFTDDTLREAPGPLLSGRVGPIHGAHACLQRRHAGGRRRA